MVVSVIGCAKYEGSGCILAQFMPIVRHLNLSIACAALLDK